MRNPVHSRKPTARRRARTSRRRRFDLQIAVLDAVFVLALGLLAVCLGRMLWILWESCQ